MESKLPSQDKDAYDHQHFKGFKPTFRLWLWDSRPNPFQKGDPLWITYGEIESIIIEEHLWELVSGLTEDPCVIISPNYMVDVKACRQIHLADHFRQRPVKRGEPHVRGDRPGSERLGSNAFAIPGKFQATT